MPPSISIAYFPMASSSLRVGLILTDPNTEQSLVSVDTILKKIRGKTDEMGWEAEHLTNKQSELRSSGTEELQKAQDAIKVKGTFHMYVAENDAFLRTFSKKFKILKLKRHNRKQWCRISHKTWSRSIMQSVTWPIPLQCWNDCRCWVCNGGRKRKDI